MITKLTGYSEELKQPKLPPSAAHAIRRRFADGDISLADLAEEYSVGRSTIHRIIHRPEPEAHRPAAPDGG
ncbi:MAG: sigma factor-like helix-turn-helix DNA-binding protein [Pseudonocardiaceae bacterium]